MTRPIRWLNESGLDRVIATFDGASRFMERARHDVAERMAKHFLVELEANWHGQRLGLHPLSIAYQAMKEKLGLDPRILIATRALVSKLKVFELGNAVYVAGVKSAERVPGSRLTYAQLMAVHEYGSDKINLPARPIFQLTFIANRLSMKLVAAQEFGRLWRAHVHRHLGRSP